MPSVLIGATIIGPQNETYVITDFLGRGAFGEVYRANGESTGTVIAVKLLPVGQLSDDTSRRALLNEIKAAQQINHPNVVRVLHVDEGSNPNWGPYVCMEYVSGGTLAQLLRAQGKAGTQMPLARALEMMIDIAQGVRAVNEKLIHRDIKPDNILIEDKILKISDFGISKFVDESTRLHTFKGGQHVAYMAPEGWAGDTNTHKLDVYAVGVVFFEILTTKHPLMSKVKDQGSMRDWEKVHLYEACPDVTGQRSDSPPQVAQLISRMTAKRPQDRPEWTQVLTILSDPAIEPVATRHPAITQAVASALAKHQEQEKQSLESARKASEAETQRLLYSHSCKALLQRLRPAVDQFNRDFQFGKIEEVAEHGITFYRLPTAKRIQVFFFAPSRTEMTEIKIRGGVVMGGGWIGLTGLVAGRSANLLLLRESNDDLYGNWIVCEVKLMALTNPQKIIGQFGITTETVEPFGFNESFFYDQIRYAQGGLHVFTYQFIDNAEDYFAGLIAEGCK
ncbi:MAG: serine/threonine protein kinase [Candidatus Sulfotelmatobacter sp.]|jgi:serine/threonine protein kinase